MKNIILCLLIIMVSTISTAVHISENNTGEVLIFPYYNVNNNFNTLINLTNTTDTAKALRVRFREAANAREVYAFNLYLGPKDAWVGGLVKGIVQGEELTRIITNDLSCTVPLINESSSSDSEVFFHNRNFTGDNQDVYGESNDRLYEGFIEVIEMGVLSGESAQAAIIENGIDNDGCSTLVNAWDEASGNGYWVDDNSIDLLPSSGGVTGNVILINVVEGLALSEEATILNDFSDEILHFNVGDDSPNLADAKNTSIVIHENEVFETQWNSGFEAVSSVLMSASLNGEYALDEEISARTEWLMTFPTAHYHTDPVYVQGDEAIAPFTNISDEQPSCEIFNIEYVFNRSGDKLSDSVGAPPPGSPPPPVAPDEELCFASNVIQFFPGSSLTPVLGSRYTPVVNVDTPYDNGWLSLRFENGASANDDNTYFSGLPVVGFAVQQYTNSNAQPGLLAQYMGEFELDKQTDISLIDDDQNLPGTAMRIAQDDTGQVLLYPYYTVRNDLTTVISIVNTTDQVKAVKIRFREGLNARETLSFNIYLDQFDVWTAGIIPTESTVSDFVGQSSARLLTSDSSCTVPIINGQEFLPFAFSGDFDDGLIQDLERVTEGSIEVIDLGTVTGDDAIAASHVFGSPQCNQLVANWTPPLGQWVVDSQVNIEPNTSKNGLMGSLSIINVANGTDMSYNAIAINNFSTEVVHSFPGDIFPNLASGNNSTTLINTQQDLFQTTWDSPLEAVTALFMQTQIVNDYALDELINAETEWVNYFPTKSFFTDPLYSQGPVPAEPFSQALNEFGTCEEHRFSSYNREQQINPGHGVAIDPPPPNFSTLPQSCFSVNVMDINKGGDLSTIFDSQLFVTDFRQDPDNASSNQLTYENGWMQMDFSDQILNPGHLTGTGPNGETHRIYGLPVIGFVAQKYVNSNAQPGLLANYGVINMNKNNRKIEVTEASDE